MPKKGVLTLKFDMATWPFLKIDMRHRTYSDRRITINDMT